MCCSHQRGIPSQGHLLDALPASLSLCFLAFSLLFLASYCLSLFKRLAKLAESLDQKLKADAAVNESR